MNHQGRDLNLCKEVVEKFIDAEAKASLQPFFWGLKIDSKYLKGYKPSTNQKKGKNSEKHQDGDKDKNKTKSHNPTVANKSQPQT